MSDRGHVYIRGYAYIEILDYDSRARYKRKFDLHRLAMEESIRWDCYHRSIRIRKSFLYKNKKSTLHPDLFFLLVTISEKKGG